MSDELRIKSQNKLTPIRRFIAGRMADSLREYPQMTAAFDIESDAVMALKDELKAQNKNVTVTAIYTRLVAKALQEYPVMNSAYVDGQMIIYDSCNVGLGVGFDHGIMTVVINEAQDKNIFEIADEMKEKTNLLKENKLPLEDMKGSTFTITSIGGMGFKYSTPVLNPPESGMLGIGVTERRLVVNDDDSTSIRQVTCFSLTQNHATTDGYHGGQFANKLRELMKDPKAHMGL